MSKKKKRLLVLSIIIFVIISITSVLTIRESILRRAEFIGDGFQFDGMVYKEIGSKEIQPYKETYSVVCKTTDGVWVIYEIQQYPDREYLVARCGWEASVVKRV
ncbi:MAG: hypothetical protein J1F04_10555 [Oscillospiraceae bacterium]|nr:hypothetical protein [Oscillospiraceae bacterium]